MKVIREPSRLHFERHKSACASGSSKLVGSSIGTVDFDVTSSKDVGSKDEIPEDRVSPMSVLRLYFLKGFINGGLESPEAAPAVSCESWLTASGAVST